MYIFVFTHKRIIEIFGKFSLILDIVEIFLLIILVEKVFYFH